MPTPGYVFEDGQTIPDSDAQPNTSLGQQPEEQPPSAPNGSDKPIVQPPKASTLDFSHKATDSHALAHASMEQDEIGVVQQGHEEGEVRDMGWQAKRPDKTLVGGLSNDDLWTLVRRFDKQMYHVKATKNTLLGGLDLEIADEDDFSPDKLRSNVERLYMTVIIGLMGFGKHIARLRSWREPRRTGAFCAAYALAWIFNLIFPLIFTTIIVLILFKPSRAFLFPHAPLALVDASTGGVQSPKAGVLGSHDSATGAPENHKGEAVEQEAHNFVTGIGTIALSSAAGKHDQGDPDEDPVDDSVPDPTTIASAGADAKVMTKGKPVTMKHDKTKKPMEEAMWTKMRPIMHTIGDIADGWERFGNLLSPTRPFPQEKPRLVLASIFVPFIAISLVTSPAVFYQISSAIVGFAFFSDPLMWRGLDYLNKNFPDWQKRLELRNSILKGVPTNAQLTITLLRVGEVNKAPLPPPPRTDAAPPSRPASINGDAVTSTLDTDHAELQSAIHKDPNDPTTTTEGASAGAGAEHKKKPGERVLGFFKGTTHAGVDTKFNIDKVRAHVIGTESARETLGIIPKNFDPQTSGPIDFKGRYKGDKGWARISTHASTNALAGQEGEHSPILSFAKNGITDAVRDVEKKATWSLKISEIVEVKKVGGLGWKAKIVVAWATGKPVADGLEITTKGGERYKITALRLRDELFNRLISMGGQKWESW